MSVTVELVKTAGGGLFWSLTAGTGKDDPFIMEILREKLFDPELNALIEESVAEDNGIGRKS